MPTFQETVILVGEEIIRMLDNMHIDDGSPADLPFSILAGRTGCFEGTMGRREVVLGLERQLRSKNLKLKKVTINKKSVFRIWQA
jgi:hypothetical protein